MRHFLDLTSAGPRELRAILEEAKRRKEARGSGAPKGAPDADRPLEGYVLAQIFEKPSTRTRISFEMAMRQLGGSTLTLSSNDLQLGRGETIEHTARVLSRYVDAIMIRTSHHEKVEEMARVATVPVINGLTDLSHPCQVMADLMTYEEHSGNVEESVWAWVGDGNNVAHSIIEAASLMNFELRLAVPDDYRPDPAVLAMAEARGGRVEVTRDVKVAVADADAVVTDTWVSMGQNGEAAKLKAMAGYQVSADVMALAKPEALFLHCLPAHVGEEVSTAVFDGPQSVVWDEAENRLHAQKAILLWCLERMGR